MCVLSSSHSPGLTLSQTFAVWPSSSSFPSIFVHNTIHYQPGISPRQALPREAIVLSESPLRLSGSLTNQSGTRRPFKMISFAIQAETNNYPRWAQRHGPEAKLHSGLRKGDNDSHQQMAQCVYFPYPKSSNNRTHTFWPLSLSASTLFFVLLCGFVP